MNFNFNKFFLFVTILFLFISCNRNLSLSKNNEDIHLADPTIFLDKNTYYLYGTAETDGFKVYISKNLKTWKDKGYALKMRESYGTKGFWAPQVFKYNNLFYIAYTANENIAIADSNSPLGPFKQKVLKNLESKVKIIDPFIFIDNGKIYLYHVRLQEGNRIFVAQLNDDFSSIKESTLKECITATESWEDTQTVNWKVAEGPSVFKKDGKYYMLYSANDFRNPDYAVGIAMAEHPLGPWKKHTENPILSRKNIHINGTGHSELFKDKKGKYQYVFHTHFSNINVSPRKTAIIELNTDNLPNKFTPMMHTLRFLKINQYAK